MSGPYFSLACMLSMFAGMHLQQGHLLQPAITFAVLAGGFWAGAWEKDRETIRSQEDQK